MREILTIRIILAGLLVGLSLLDHGPNANAGSLAEAVEATAFQHLTAYEGTRFETEDRTDWEPGEDLETIPDTQGTATLTSPPDRSGIILNSLPPSPWRFADLFKIPGEPRGSAEEMGGKTEEVKSIYNLPIIRNTSVESHIRYFHIAIRDRFKQWLERLGRYRPIVENIFSEFDLPPDLVFLSLVESGFNPHAYSRARATGPWQFMKGTAKLYGLRIDRYVDERRDPIKSTIAAARYLRDLYDLFGTWPLAMAAYNAGEGKIIRALQKTQADNFWTIAQTKHLRRETKEYVPRFMAATIIARNPGQYGFPEVAPKLHQFEEVIVRRPVHLRSVAAATGISFLELRQLNPELRLDITPPDDPEYHLKVPVGTRAKVEQNLDRIPTWKPSVTAVKKGKDRNRSGGWYRVQIGDTLLSIAKRFHLPVEELKALNRLKSHLIKPGDLLAVPSRHQR